MIERQRPPEERSSERASEQIGQEVRSRSGEMKEGVKAQARELRQEAEERAERWTSSVGHQAESLARALRVASDSLWTEGEERMASFVSQAAEQVDRMSGYFEDENPSGMIEDLEDLGRRNPGAFLGSAFAMGLAAGRFLRASTPNGRARSAEGSGREPGSRVGVGATASAYSAFTDPTAFGASPASSGPTSTPATPGTNPLERREGSAGTEGRS